MRTRIAWLLLFAMILSACQSLERAGNSVQFAARSISAPDCNYGGKLKSIDSIDASTVRFTLCSPDPAFLYKVAFGAFAIQDENYLNENQGDSLKMSETPNVSGPYRVKDWQKGRQLVLEANPDYWGVPPKSGEIVFRWSNDPAARLQVLKTSGVDGIDNVSPEQFAEVQQNSNLRFYQRTPMNVMYLGMNNTFAPFDNENVRRAFAMAVDRKAIVLKYYPLGSQVADQFVPPTIHPGASENLPWYNFDPKQAAQLLKDSGFDFNKEIVLSFFNASRPYLPDPPGVAGMVKKDLEKIGVKIQLKEMETGSFIESVAAGKEAFFMLGWSGDYPDASNFYEFHFTGASKNFGNPIPELEKAVIAGGSTSDSADRQKQYDQVNLLIKQKIPVIPIAHGVSAMAFNVGVQNVTVGPLNENYEEMSTNNNRLVFMQASEPGILWPSDETYGDTLRPATLMYDTLLRYDYGGVGVQPSLAENWETNKDATQWTFYLRRGVKFSNGSLLDANDVLASFAALWDASSPNHKGNTGMFEYFAGFFGDFINKK